MPPSSSCPSPTVVHEAYKRYLDSSNQVPVYHRGLIERDSEQSGPARRHLQEALQINPYFSPLRVPLAKEALAALGEPPNTGVPDQDTQDAQNAQDAQDAKPSRQ